jgi:septal ring factor EnvC (AmiA/AmiB activator)
MRKYLILILFTVLPFLSNAQIPNSPRIQMAQRNQQWTNQQNLKWNNRMMGDSKSQTEIAEKKIAKEEQNIQKLEEKITQLNSDLEKQRNQLLALENSPNNTNDYTQKECKKTKGQIAKIEEKLSKSKTELEASSKKIEILKLVGKFSVTNKEQLNK